jgi:hypothetical protein
VRVKSRRCGAASRYRFATSVAPPVVERAKRDETRRPRSLSERSETKRAETRRPRSLSERSETKRAHPSQSLSATQPPQQPVVPLRPSLEAGAIHFFHRPDPRSWLSAGELLGVLALQLGDRVDDHGARLGFGRAGRAGLLVAAHGDQQRDDGDNAAHESADSADPPWDHDAPEVGRRVRQDHAPRLPIGRPAADRLRTR